MKPNQLIVHFAVVERHGKLLPDGNHKCDQCPSVFIKHFALLKHYEAHDLAKKLAIESDSPTQV